MKTWTLRPLARALCLGAALTALAACYYVPPQPVAYAGPPPAAPGYYYAPGYAYGPPVVGSVNLGFGYWGGRRWR